MKKDETIAVGVGAVVFRKNEVLLVKRGKAPLLGQWSIPGGGLHHGERLEDAVAREVREETTIEIRVIGLINVFEALPYSASGERHYLMIDYAAEWVAGEPVAGDDAAEAEFVSIDEAKTRLEWDETRKALEMALAMRP
ncbi:MAG: NUDIX hydrolase [Pseudomonadota bacterium]